jgi:uncharacterized protein YdaU (DUF1376 family)
MHYYQHHIGDFIKATARLSDSQAMAYLRLIWMYYDSEKPLKPDTKLLAFQIGATVEETELILESYFWLAESGWHHTRCDQEIAEYRSLMDKRSTAGKASAQRRLNKSESNDEQVFNKCLADVQLTNNHKPITNNHNLKDANASMSGTAFPTCPHQKILSLYAKHLGHLQQPRVWEGNRATMLRQRWVQASKPSTFSPEGYKTESDGLAWWDSFFAYIANDTKLSSGFESQGRLWRPDLPWIVNSTNFAKIIDGKYDK